MEAMLKSEDAQTQHALELAQLTTQRLKAQLADERKTKKQQHKQAKQHTKQLVRDTHTHTHTHTTHSLTVGTCAY
jgi:ElaB/YqjD/DUF883 family membrane-anchored ribosome-binding protein